MPKRLGIAAIEGNLLSSESIDSNVNLTVMLEKTSESLGQQGDQTSQSKEINPEYSLQGLMLKLQYFGCLMQRADSLEKTLMLGKIEGRRRRG